MADIEQTRAVVESGEEFDGRIIPTEQAEIDRPVRIQDAATVRGSVYGASVELSDDATVDGSVMASDAVELSNGVVHGEVGTPGKVVADHAHVDGTVTGKRVRLVDCVVRGNVVGTEVILENCVVLGIATADRRLTMENSLCYTFRSRGETTLADVSVVLPQAIADGALELETPVGVVGLGHLDAASDDPAGDAGATDLPEMGVDDLYEQDGTRYLTLAPRILNLEKVTDRLDELEQAVMAAVDDTSGEGRAEMSVDEVLSRLDVDGHRTPDVD